MYGLIRELVELKILMYRGVELMIQSQRRITLEFISNVKEEVQRLMEAKFTRIVRYVEWLFNTVHVLKKNNKTKVYIDFRELNKATPKMSI